jgi:hypothetical protein
MTVNAEKINDKVVDEILRVAIDASKKQELALLVML